MRSCRSPSCLREPTMPPVVKNARAVASCSGVRGPQEPATWVISCDGNTIRGFSGERRIAQGAAGRGTRELFGDGRALRDLSHPVGAAPGDRQNAHGANIFLDVKSDDALPRTWKSTKTGRDFVPSGSAIRVFPKSIRIRVKGGDFPCDGPGCREIEQKGHDASDVPVHEWMPDNLKPGHRRDALPAPLRGSSRNLPGRVPRTPRQELPHGGGFLPPSPPV